MTNDEDKTTDKNPWPDTGKTMHHNDRRWVECACRMPEVDHDDQWLAEHDREVWNQAISAVAEKAKEIFAPFAAVAQGLFETLLRLRKE